MSCSICMREYQTTPKAVEVDNVAAVYGDFTTLMLLKKDGSLWHYQDGAFVKLMDGVKCPGTAEQAKSDQPSPWAEEFVDTAIEAGLVPQSLQSQYTQATTRAEFCALGVKLYEVIAGQEIQSRATFTDTQDENVEKLASLGVIAGVGEGRFSPDSAFNREQAALILANLAKALGCPLPASTPTFADSGSISDWAQAAVGQVQAAGVMSGVGENTFAPAAHYSREQSITTILTLYSQVR